MEKVLVLFSGGKDSLLATIQLLASGKDVYLVNYENSCHQKEKNVLHGVRRLIKKYGEEHCHFLGIQNITAIWRSFLLPYYNLKPSTIHDRYGEVSISQFNCLSCRLAMYTATVLLCHQYNIDTVVDGARKSQLFAIEQDPLLERFQQFFNEHQIKIMFPLRDLIDDFELKNELLFYGFTPKVLEAQCLLGMPLTEGEVDHELIEGTAQVFDQYLKEKANLWIQKHQNVKSCEKGDGFF